MIVHGDCLEQLKLMADNSVDSVVTDPPYGLKFMGKKWDHDVPSPDIWRECLRVLKPGGYLLSFGGTRTYHRMVVAIEDAGFEIKDQLQWLTGSGFPKSLNVRKSGIKQGIVCACEIEHEDENLRSLQSDMGPENTVPGNSKQDLFTSLCGPVNQPKNRWQVPDSTDGLHSVQKRVQAEMAKPSQDMLLSVSRQSKILEAREHGAHEADCREHEGSQTSATIRPNKSGLEGRSNLQTDQGQLHRSEVCTVSSKVDSDGSQGRLHNGTSSDNGHAHGSVPNKDRSGSPQGSQHSKQSHIQSGIFPNQSSPQNCGRCGKPRIEEGLGTALKPANEPIVLARKPLDAACTIAENVLKWGVGGLNIDASRIGFSASENIDFTKVQDGNIYGGNGIYGEAEQKQTTPLFKESGRWPANIILDEEAAAMLDEQSGQLSQCGSPKKTTHDEGMFGIGTPGRIYKEEHRGASRFFYVAKASKRERNAGCEGMPFVKVQDYAEGTKRKLVAQAENYKNPNLPRANHHPTVKPIKLMEYLIRLITPPGGIVLDPFAGSGSTGVAAKRLGFKFIGIELNSEYVEIAEKRIEAVV